MNPRWSEKGLLVSVSDVAPAWLRAGLVAFSLVLIAQAMWILLAEYHHPRRIRLPLDEPASAVARLDRDNASRAAERAVVRGDLWAESAFTYANLIWTQPVRGVELSAETGRLARAQLERALRYSPHRGDVWLLLAAMAERYGWQDQKPIALLKMSYYTAPNERALFPMRVRAALAANGLQDMELPDMIRRDIRLMARTPVFKPALAAIYKSASGPNREFIERAMSEIDPAYLASLRAGL